MLRENRTDNGRGKYDSIKKKRPRKRKETKNKIS